MTTFGYLETPYLVGSYLLAVVTTPTFSQFDQKIASSKSTRAQVEARIEGAIKSTRTQYDRLLADNNKITLSQFDQRIDSGSKTTRSEIDRRIEATNVLRAQFDRKTVGSSSILSQIDRKIEAISALREQVDRKITDDFSTRSQFKGLITNGSKLTLFEFGRGWVSHEICDGYLIGPYLSQPYLAPFICAHLYSQTEFRLEKTFALRSQFDRRIDSGSKVTREQFDQRIEDSYSLRTQFQRVSAYRLNSQILFAIYNTTNLRILCDFPSRGTTGTNWSVIAGGTAAGDRGINNVNTDIVEQVYRSTATTVTLQCDTQIVQGIFNDTVAILGHNFTTSASVTMQGSNDVTFSSIPLSETLTVERENLYWVSEFLPLQSYRYWRFIISDVTNTNGYIQIGTILFGSSIIFNGECFTDEVVRKKTHFADRIRTEGYSAVSNDRALKKGLGLRFQKLNYNRENYEKLVDVIDTARTSLKCLWIPTPQYASRFAVFAKLSEMPVENHKAISEDADYIDLEVNLDESL